jgi:drug/metabolite transporter (DMT)-like permease
MGVLIMVQPGSSRFELAMLFALYSAFGYAVGQLIGRHLTRTVSVAVISNWQNFVYGATGLLLAVVFSVVDFSGSTDKSLAFLTRTWIWPDAMQLIVLLIMGLLAAIGSLLFVSAYKFAEANFVAPFEYSALIWATLYGMLLFGDLPDRYVLLGAAVVVGAGLYMMWSERRARLQPIG